MQSVFSWYVARLQTKAFPEESGDLASSSFLQAVSAELLSLQPWIETLDSVQAVTSKSLNGLCLALQSLKSVAVMPFTSVKMLFCQRDILHQTQWSTNRQDALLCGYGKLQWPKQYLYAAIHMPNLTHKVPGQTFNRRFWWFSLSPVLNISPVLAEKLHWYSFSAPT